MLRSLLCKNYLFNIFRILEIVHIFLPCDKVIVISLYFLSQLGGVNHRKETSQNTYPRTMKLYSRIGSNNMLFLDGVACNECFYFSVGRRSDGHFRPQGS